MWHRAETRSLHSIPSMRILTVPSEPQTTTVSADLDRASNAPINRLPMELLAEIFEMLLTRIIDDFDLYLSPLTRLECTVAHVCRFWRHVAYSSTTHRRCGPISRIRSARTFNDIFHSPEAVSSIWTLTVTDLCR